MVRSEEAGTSQRGLCFLLALAFAGLFLAVAEGSARLVEDPFPGFLVWDNGTLVAFHRDGWSGARAGMPLGRGRIVEVEGEPFRGGRALLELAAARPVGSAIRYRVQSGDAQREVVVPSMRLGPVDYVSTFGNYLFNALSFAMIGIVSLWLRRDSQQGRALAGATLAIAALFALAIDYFSGYRFVIACQAVESVAPLAVAGLALRFPYPRGHPAFRRVVFAALAVFALMVFGAQRAWFYAEPARAGMATLAVYVALASITLAMLVGLTAAIARAERTLDRVRAGVVLAAAVTGLLVPALSILAFYGLSGGFSFTWVTFLLPVFPTAVLFAIVRHDLLGAERVARLAVGYGLTTAGLAITYSSLLIAADEFFVSSGGVGARRTITEFLLLIGVAVLFQPFYRRIQAAIDRGFYRSDLDAGEVLERMSAALSAASTEAEVVAAVESEVVRALQVDWAEVSAGDDRRGNDLTKGEPVLEVPIVHGSENLATLRSGAKSSSAPFSRIERDLLVGIAGQAATAIRNTRSLDELRDIQEALMRSERLAAIGEVAGAVAHGVRNPLAGIRAAAQMAQELEDRSERDEALGDITEGVDRLDERVRRLLDFSRPIAPELEVVELGAVFEGVRSALANHASQRGVALRVELPGAGELSQASPIYLHADPSQLEEVLLELVGNALHATTAEGHVTLRAERDGRRARIEVSDTGVGIPEAVRDRVFDLFFTTRESGTGMGLATVRKMLARQDGTVELSSTGPEGTTFAVWLPLAEDPSAAGGTRAASA